VIFFASKLGPVTLLEVPGEAEGKDGVLELMPVLLMSSEHLLGGKNEGGGTESGTDTNNGGRGDEADRVKGGGGSEMRNA